MDGEALEHVRNECENLAKCQSLRLIGAAVALCVLLMNMFFVHEDQVVGWHEDSGMFRQAQLMDNISASHFSHC